MGKSSHLLLLHNRYSYSTVDIERAAKNRGWDFERIIGDNINELVEGYDNDKIFYYGNTIEFPKIIIKLPIKEVLLNPKLLDASDTLTKRSTMTRTFKEFSSPELFSLPLFDVTKPFTFDIFCKPFGDKIFEAKVYKKGERLELNHPDFIPFAGHENDFIHMSNPINYIHSEIRCFCLNGKVLTASYYRMMSKWEQARCEKSDLDSTDIPQMVEKLYDRHPGLPPGTVFDFGWNLELDWFLIEQNQSWASSIYSCDPDLALESIIHSVKIK